MRTKWGTFLGHVSAVLASVGIILGFGASWLDQRLRVFAEDLTPVKRTEKIEQRLIDIERQQVDQDKSLAQAMAEAALVRSEINHKLDMLGVTVTNIWDRVQLERKLSSGNSF